MTTNNQTSIASLAKKRRTYSAEFKQQIVQACKAPDVSIASVALQHGLNTNLVSKWIRLIDAKPGSDRSPLPYELCGEYNLQNHTDLIRLVRLCHKCCEDNESDGSSKRYLNKSQLTAADKNREICMLPSVLDKNAA